MFRSPAACRREAKPPVADGYGEGKEEEDRSEGDEATGDGCDVSIDGGSLAIAGGLASAIVVTLPCLECPRIGGGRAESAFGTLRRFCGPAVGPSDGTVPNPEFVRDKGKEGMLLFFIAENEASLTGDIGR